MKQFQSFSIANRLVIIVLCGGVVIGLTISLLFNLFALKQPLDRAQWQLQQAMVAELKNSSLRSLSHHAIEPVYFQHLSHKVASDASGSSVTVGVIQSQWHDLQEVADRTATSVWHRYRYAITYVDIPSGVASDPSRVRRMVWLWDLQPLQHSLAYQLVTRLSRDLAMVTLLILLILFGLHRRILVPVQNFDANYLDALQGASHRVHTANDGQNTTANQVGNREANRQNKSEGNSEGSSEGKSASQKATTDSDYPLMMAPEELQCVQESILGLQAEVQQQQVLKQQAQQQLIEVKQELTAKVRELEQQLKQLELSNDQLLQSNQFLQQEAQLTDQYPLQSRDQMIDTQPASNNPATDITQLAQLAAGMAHEINNPVAIVYSNIATLKEYIAELITLAEQYQQVDDDMTQSEIAEILQQLRHSMDFDFIQADANDLIQSSRESLERVRNIVAELHTFADGDVRQQEAVVIDDLVLETLNDVSASPVIQISNVLMTLSPIYVVRDQVKVALQKVLSNAIDSMPEGGNIEIAAVEEKDNISVTIKDSGCGMSQEALSHATEPFFTQKEIGQGLGLGLTVANNLISHQGGKLLIDSHQGNGTMVTMNFPRMSIQ